MKPDRINTIADYSLALLWLIDRLKQASMSEAITTFGNEFESAIPAADRNTYPNGSIKWEQYVSGARFGLVNEEFMAVSQSGVWTITTAGSEWLQQNPEATSRDLMTYKFRRDVVRRPQSKSDLIRQDQALTTTTADSMMSDTSRPRIGSLHGPENFVINGVHLELSAERILEVARQALVVGLPDEALRENWVVLVDGRPIGLRWLFNKVTGINNIYSARNILGHLGLEVGWLTEKPSRDMIITMPIPDSGIKERNYEVVVRTDETAIRNVLQGRGERPDDDRICDMVQFCYTQKLYREGCTLFRLVDKSCTNSQHYERTRKLAKICELRAESRR